MNIRSPWHDIETGDKSPEIVNVIIEIPKDSQIKYEVDKKTGLLRLDRFLYSAMHYPGDYGFVPKTLWYDEDPIDIIVLTSKPLNPMTLASVRILGALEMIDGEEKDDKIIGVYDCDPRFKEFENITDVPKHIISELKNFFERYKELQGGECKIIKILDKNTAKEYIELAQEMYKARFTKKEDLFLRHYVDP